MKRSQAGMLVKSCEYLLTSEKAVLLALLERADNETCSLPKTMTPTVATLAVWTSLSLRTVQRVLAHLEKHGWARVTRGGNGRGIKSEYELVPREPDISCDCERVSPVRPLRAQKGVTVTPFKTEKGDTDDAKGCHERQERVTSGSESSQVNDGFAHREKRGHVRGSVIEGYKRCHSCASTDTQIIGAYRFCREHAGPRWKDTA